AAPRDVYVCDSVTFPGSEQSGGGGTRDRHRSWSSEATSGRWRKRVEHFLHAVDLGGLIDLHVVRELEHDLVLRGAVGSEQLLDHRDRAVVVLHHEAQKEPVEL